MREQALNFLEEINAYIEKGEFSKLQELLTSEKVFLGEVEQNWENSPLVKLIESAIDSYEKVELFKKLVERGVRLNITNVSEFGERGLLSIIVGNYSFDGNQYVGINESEKELIKFIAEQNPEELHRKQFADLDLFGYLIYYAISEDCVEDLKKLVDVNQEVYGRYAGEVLVENGKLSVLESIASEMNSSHVYQATNEIFKKIIEGERGKDYRRAFEALNTKDKLGFYKAMHQHKIAILNMAIEKSDFAILENSLVGSEIGPLNYFIKEQLKNAIRGQNPNNPVIKAIGDFYRKYKDDEVWLGMQDEVGSTQLEREVIEGNIDACRLLIEKGADLKSTLNIASGEGHLEIVQLLIYAGADVNPKEEYNYTPLHEAIIRRHVEVTKILIEAGANVNVQNAIGMTPLHFATINGCKKTIELLIYAGADVNIFHDDGKNPLYEAAFSCHMDICKLLIEKGGKLIFEEEQNICNKHYLLEALHFSLRNNKIDEKWLDTLKLIIEKYEEKGIDWNEFFKHEYIAGTKEGMKMLSEINSLIEDKIKNKLILDLQNQVRSLRTENADLKSEVLRLQNIYEPQNVKIVNLEESATSILSSMSKRDREEDGKDQSKKQRFA